MLSGCKFVKNIAPSLLSHDKRIKIEQNKQIIASFCKVFAKAVSATTLK